MTTQFIADAESEILVMGSLIVGSADAAYWCSLLNEDCFTDHRIVSTFLAIQEILERGERPDFVSIEEQLRLFHPNSNVTPALLVDWMEKDQPDHLHQAVTLLHQFRARRQLYNIAVIIGSKVANPLIPIQELMEEVQQKLDAIDLSPTGHGESLGQVADRVERRMLDNLNPDTRHTGPVTGISEIDQEAPLPESGLVVVAGASSSGKSAFANQIALQSVRKGMKVAYMSKEMPNDDTVSRMVAMGTQGTAASWIMDRPLNSIHLEDAQHSLERLRAEYGTSIYFDDSRSLQLSDVTSSIRRLQKERGIRIAVVDYLQLLAHDADRGRFSNQEQLMGYYSRVLKNLGDQLGVTIIALSQLNRNLPQGRPTNASLRDSGQIAEAADYILLLWRPERTHGLYDGEYAQCPTSGTALLIVDKNRRGPTMDTLVGWKGLTTKFFELTKEQIEQYKAGRTPTVQELQQRLFDSF